MPSFAQAGIEQPQWEDFMPDRYERSRKPKKELPQPEDPSKTFGGMLSALKLKQ
jgi:hypothetical protein